MKTKTTNQATESLKELIEEPITGATKAELLGILAQDGVDVNVRDLMVGSLKPGTPPIRKPGTLLDYYRAQEELYSEQLRKLNDEGTFTDGKAIQMLTDNVLRARELAEIMIANGGKRLFRGQLTDEAGMAQILQGEEGKVPFRASMVSKEAYARYRTMEILDQIGLQIHNPFFFEDAK